MALWDLERRRAVDKTVPAVAGDDRLAQTMNDQINGALQTWSSLALLMQQVGAFLGMYTFGWVAQKIGRRPTFFMALSAAAVSTAYVFWFMNEHTDIFWMVPIMGYFQLSLFAGYAIYFPELFPTYLRSTGTSFCYNVGRFVAATGPTMLTFLASDVFGGYPEPYPWRYAGVSMCAIFIVGILVLPFAPETKDRPLPE
jgi:MFS family permease